MPSMTMQDACRLLRATIASVVLLLAPTRVLEAQFEALLSGITDVSVYSACVRGQSSFGPRCSSVDSYGFEVTWRVREIPLAHSKRSANPPAPLDSTDKVISIAAKVTRSGDGRTVTFDTVTTFTRSAAVSTDRWLIVELGLGYSQVGALQSLETTHSLRGSIRELPALTAYISYERGKWWGPYFGLRSGLIEITGLHALEETSSGPSPAHRASAKAVQAGALVGLAVGNEHVIGRIELGYTIRKFTSIDWGGAAVPDFLPRDIDVSGPSLLIGLQFVLREFKGS